VKVSAHLKSTVITKQHSGAIYEMEKLLTMWMEDQIQNRMPLSLLTTQAKARSLFEAIKGKYSDPNTKFEDRTYISKEENTMPGFKAAKD
jgi:hypothetical protein